MRIWILSKIFAFGVATILVAGCESKAPSASTDLEPGIASLPVARQQTEDDTPEQESDPDGGQPPGWAPMPGATCTFIDIQQRRVERVNGLRATLRILADTTVDGNFYARVWLSERHTTLLGDFDLERGEVTLFTVTLPRPGEHRLFIDVEANDRERNHTQCDFSLTLTV